MNEIRVEQIIKVKTPKKANFYKITMVTLSIISLFFIFVAFGLFLTAGLVAFTVIMFRYYNYEFEYSLVEKTLTIDRISSKSYRRSSGVYSVGNLEIMAPYGSDKLASYEKRNCKSYDYSSNTDPSKTYVLFLPCNHETVRIVLEPNENMKKAIWSLSPSKVTL